MTGNHFSEGVEMHPRRFILTEKRMNPLDTGRFFQTGLPINVPKSELKGKVRLHYEVLVSSNFIALVFDASLGFILESQSLSHIFEI